MPRPESITARELVRLRVRDEVARYNSTRPEYFRGLVQPTDAEATLNGYRRRRPSRLLALHAFGALTAAAQLRRDALARLLPRTKIADQVQLEERFVRVRGRIGTYRIHLGSGNILMAPSDQYLCIVAAREKKTGTIVLPFDDDPMLSTILSKAYLLGRQDH